MSARLREAIQASLDADGVDDRELSIEIRFAALELGELVDPDGRRRRCPHCGIVDWPGRIQDHIRRVHEPAPARERRASVRIHLPPRRSGAGDRAGTA